MSLLTVSCRTFLVFTFLLPMLQAHAQPQQVVLVAEDGYNIASTLTRPATKHKSAAGVVLLHMYRQTKESWQPLVEKLVAQGMTTIVIDLRGHGQSRTTPDGSDGNKRVISRDPQFFNAMYLDAEAAINFLVTKEEIAPEKIALVGASVGCSVAIKTATINPVAGVVVMTPGRDYLGIPTMEHIQKWVDTPLLILTSKEEANRGAAPIYAKLKNNGAELTVFDEEDIHGTNMFDEVEGVENFITKWLAAHLGI